MTDEMISQRMMQVGILLSPLLVGVVQFLAFVK